MGEKEGGREGVSEGGREWEGGKDTDTEGRNERSRRCCRVMCTWPPG